MPWTSRKSQSYGKLCVNGDTICMTVDLVKFTISYKINDVDYGDAFGRGARKLLKEDDWFPCITFSNSKAHGIVDIEMI